MRWFLLTWRCVETWCHIINFCCQRVQIFTHTPPPPKHIISLHKGPSLLPSACSLTSSPVSSRARALDPLLPSLPVPPLPLLFLAPLASPRWSSFTASHLCVAEKNKDEIRQRSPAQWCRGGGGCSVGGGNELEELVVRDERQPCIVRGELERGSDRGRRWLQRQVKDSVQVQHGRGKVDAWWWWKLVACC
jgi:hypothetical protein